MRLDLYLKLMGVAKTRSMAARLITGGHLQAVNAPGFVAGRLKPSHEVVVGERYQVERVAGADHFEVLAIPEVKSLAKKDRALYIKVVRPGDIV